LGVNPEGAFLININSFLGSVSWICLLDNTSDTQEMNWQKNRKVAKRQRRPQGCFACPCNPTAQEYQILKMKPYGQQVVHS
jgi:hypothetical protein